MNFLATRSTVPGRGVPPTSFLTELVLWIASADLTIFEPNDDPEDVYNRLAPILGPWSSLDHRRAAMAELLRCLAGFESSWKWTEGVDRTNPTSMRLITGQETGIFQVSYDSLNLDMVGSDRTADLHDCVIEHCGNLEVQNFIDTMKTNHEFALEYAARLLRNSYFWDGPIKRHEIDRVLSRAAVSEFQSLIATVAK